MGKKSDQAIDPLDDIILVTEPSETRLNERQYLDYRTWGGVVHYSVSQALKPRRLRRGYSVPRNLRFLVCERDAKRLVNAVIVSLPR